MNDFEKMKHNTIVLCFSSGQTSAYMTKKTLQELECKPAIRNGIQCHISKFNRYVFVVFNNTSREDEESLIFAHKCDIEFGFRVIWLQASINPKGIGPTPNIVSFETACRNGDVFEAFIAKHGIPQPGKRKCTEVLKTQNTNAFIKLQGLGKVYQCVGIRIDEPHRHKWDKAIKNRVIWPLTTIWPTTKFEVIHFFNHNSFRLMIKSYEGNCVDCHLKGLRKLMTIAKNNPEKLEWSVRVEDKYAYYIPEGHSTITIKVPIKRHRDYLSTAEILEMAQTEEFIEANDETNLSDYYYDANEECGESCDAFG